MPPDGRNLISDLIKHFDICGCHVGGCSYCCLVGFDALKFGTEVYDMIYLTAIRLSHGGSSTVHIYTHTVHRTTQITTEQHK